MRVRLRPILMTTAATVLGVVSMFYTMFAKPDHHAAPETATLVPSPA